jgi:hypothetical protein
LFTQVDKVSSSPSGDITLISATSLDINSALATTGTVRLQAAGSITQTAAGVITANKLGVFTSVGKIDLENTANNVQRFAANDAAAGQMITFVDNSSSLTIGSVAADADGCTFIIGGIPTAVTGITTTGNGSITVFNGRDPALPGTVGGSLTIIQSINAGTGTVLLQANGDVTQHTTDGPGGLRCVRQDRPGKHAQCGEHILGDGHRSGTAHHVRG